jgi:hypothetical protein
VAIVDDTIVWSDPDGVPATVEPLTGDGDRLRASQRSVGITPATIESRMADARLDVHFVVSVLAEHIARQRRRLRGDVETATPRPPVSPSARGFARSARGCPGGDTPRW